MKDKIREIIELYESMTLSQQEYVKGMFRMMEEE
tara:strand:- start:120 stop:221 length:102 start_codon:yes stop_codon:yes gene_type:complete